MSREVDRRRRQPGLVTPERQTRLRELAAEVSSERLEGEHRLEVATVDSTTGNPAATRSEAAPAEQGNYVQRALDHLQAAAPALGLEATQPTEYVVDPSTQRTSAGAVTVHAQQRYKGVPIFQAAQAVLFDPDGRLAQTVGTTVTVPHELEVAPRLSVEEAVLAAAEQVAEPDQDERGLTDEFGQPMEPAGVRLDGFLIRVTATFPDRPERPTVLAPGPFAEDIRASLTWFPLDPGDLRLGWLVVLTMPGHAAQYRVVVDAGSGEVLYCRQLVQTVAARGSVFPVDGAGARRTSEFPRPLADYNLPVPAGLPDGFPDTWVQADRTVGNSVNAHLSDDGPAVQGALQDGVVVFDPADPRSDEQLAVNLFYLGCSMHDFFYLLGFQERDGSFQRDNFGRGGLGADPVDARAHPGPVFGTANMFTPVDGSSPVMNMGLVSSTGRHTALDSSVVYHEFMHGVTNRLVGGPMNVDALDEPQSAGMGEGWGDYVACVINQTEVVGAWVTGKAGGIRGFRYDAQFPGTFADLGSGRYTRVHAMGEIWCATLMEMTRRVGQPLAVQLVVDALKLARANPSFLDMRDAVLAALDGKLAAGQLTPAAHRTALAAIWGAFARFGMGPAADCVGATLVGIEPDFEGPDLPVEPDPEPDPDPDPEPTDPEPEPTDPDPAPPDPGPVPPPLPAEARDVTVMVELALDAGGQVGRAAVVQVGEGNGGGRDVADGDGRLVRYFVEHVTLRDPAGAAPPPEARLEVDELAFEELPGGGPDGTAGQVRAEVTFRVTGPDAAEVAAARPSWFAHVLAHVPATGETTVLAAVGGELRPGGDDQTATLELTTPPAGRYQLLGVVVLADRRLLGSTVGPRLTVVP
jgi:extracellular elastinolytic metalloproteinase